MSSNICKKFWYSIEFFRLSLPVFLVSTYILVFNLRLFYLQMEVKTYDARIYFEMCAPQKKGATCNKISIFKIAGFLLAKNEARIEDIWIPLLHWTAQRWKTSYYCQSNGGPSVTATPNNSRKFSSASWGGICFDVFSFSLLKNRWSVDEISNPLLLWSGVSSPTDGETGMTGPGGHHKDARVRTRGIIWDDSGW